MSRPRLLLQRTFVFVSLVTAGVVALLWLQSSRTKPKQRPPNERGRVARVLELATIDAVPRTIGYGVVEAKREWQSVAEVSGEIVELGEGVELGRVVQEGTLLFRIEPRSYELEESRTEATVRAVRAQIEEIKAREESARASLKVEERVLDLARADLERTRILYEGGNAPLLDLDNAERTVLTAEKAVQAIKSTLLELPASRKVLAAQLVQMQVGVEGAQLSLAKTEVVAPFTMRIRELNIALHQAVSSGTVMLIGDGIEAVEIPASADGASDAGASPELEAAGSGDAVAGGSGDEAPAGTPPPRDAAGDTRRTGRGGIGSGVEARVRFENQGITSTWEGRFLRILGVDPTTRTVGVMVGVDEPRRREHGPPLVPGLHVEVELRGEPRADCLAIPRAALHGDVVWVVDEDDRLELRGVTASVVQEDFVCLDAGAAPGERIVLTDLTPAVAGMLLAPRPDPEAESSLRAVAKGEEPRS